VERNAHDLIEVLFRRLPGIDEENYEKSLSG
jgi:hypothetical protein